jgi:hypothetical protein
MEKNNKLLNNVKNFYFDSNIEGNLSQIINLIFEGLSNLERGVKGFKKNVSTPVGKIDILAKDIIGRIVIVEIDADHENDLLFNAIDHFDWALNHMEELIKEYKDEELDPTLAPRIILLAPSYSEKFIRRASYLSPTFIDIYEYQLRETAGIRKIYFRPFSFVNEKKWVLDLHAKSIEDHLNFIENKELRNLAKNFISELQALRNDLLLNTSKGYILFKTKKGDKKVAIYTLKNGFWVNFASKRWKGVFVKSAKDIDSIKQTLGERLLSK